jgi:ABC-type glycerol-3-phosphate transport system permease component
MLFEFCVYFFILCFTSIFFIIISSDTSQLKPEYVERMEYLNDVLVKRLAPILAAIALCLIPVVIVCGV